MKWRSCGAGGTIDFPAPCPYGSAQAALLDDSNPYGPLSVAGRAAGPLVNRILFSPGGGDNVVVANLGSRGQDGISFSLGNDGRPHLRWTYLRAPIPDIGIHLQSTTDLQLC